MQTLASAMPCPSLAANPPSAGRDSLFTPVWPSLDSAAMAAVLPDPEALAAIPKPVAERFRVAPLEHRGDCVVVAMVDAGDVHTIDELGRVAGLRVRPV